MMIKVEHDGTGRGVVSSPAWVSPYGVAFVTQCPSHSDRAHIYFTDGKDHLEIRESVESFCDRLEEAWRHQ